MIRFAYGRVTELRRSRGLTRTDLAQPLGVSRWAVGRWEQGAQTPRPSHVRKLAAVLGVSTQEFWEPDSAAAAPKLKRERRRNEAKLLRDRLRGSLAPVLMGNEGTGTSDSDVSDPGTDEPLPSFGSPPGSALVAQLERDGFSLADVVGLLRDAQVEPARRITEIYDRMSDEERASATLDHLIAAAAAPTAKVVEAGRSSESASTR
jgi:transcriptional regulator with XRE-family HTH domain